MTFPMTQVSLCCVPSHAVSSQTGFSSFSPSLREGISPGPLYPPLQRPLGPDSCSCVSQDVDEKTSISEHHCVSAAQIVQLMVLLWLVPHTQKLSPRRIHYYPGSQGARMKEPELETRVCDSTFKLPIDILAPEGWSGFQIWSQDLLSCGPFVSLQTGCSRPQLVFQEGGAHRAEVPQLEKPPSE